MAAPRRKPEDIPGDELLVYDLASQRWKDLEPDKVLEEAALLFNLAVFMVSTEIRKRGR